MRLKDRSAIVTGAASGIGRDVAMPFAREGATVAIDQPHQGMDAGAGETSAGDKARP
jgi:NAD(P)-dependent dehydrogenase (short-subunit alcohol dehydrogenase family)